MADLASELSDLMRDLQDRKAHSEWLIEHWPTVMAALRKSSAPSSARLATEAVPVADIEAEIAHIEENGQRVKELPGMTDEWRCRELCAMYLREFISNLRANKRLAELSARPAAPSSEGVTCPECATARAAANSWKDELMRLKSAQPAGAVALEAQEVVERWNHAVEECALAAEHVTPRHTECGNKIARAIRALKGLPSAPSATPRTSPPVIEGGCCGQQGSEWGPCNGCPDPNPSDSRSDR